MRTDVYRYAHNASLFIVVPSGSTPPSRVRVSSELEIEAGDWQFSRELEIDAAKVYVGLDVDTAVDDLARQRWHLGTSGDSSR